jgi:hypothetical protein
VIGTPTEETWPGVSTLPEYKPFSIYQPILSLIHFVPKLNNNGKDLLLVSIYLSAIVYSSNRVNHVIDLNVSNRNLMSSRIYI